MDHMHSMNNANNKVESPVASVVVLPMNNTQNPVIINPSTPTQSQLPTSITTMSSNNTNRDQQLVVTLNDNVTLATAASDKVTNQFLQDFASNKKDEGELFISEDPDNVAVDISSNAGISEAATSSFNSDIWVNYSTENQDINKQVEEDQYSVATLVIDGTNYLVQVVNEPDQSQCSVDQESIVNALTSSVLTTPLGGSKGPDVELPLVGNLILHTQPSGEISTGNDISIDLNSSTTSCATGSRLISDMIQDVSQINSQCDVNFQQATTTFLCNQPTNPILTFTNQNSVTSSMLTTPVTTDQQIKLDTDKSYSKVVKKRGLHAKGQRLPSSTSKSKITVKLPISSSSRQRHHVTQ
uniref:Uncharacterized protein n=3 Tax=Ciona intestinalis TaxID=7719 RepID=F6YHR0_CIOIN